MLTSLDVANKELKGTLKYVVAYKQQALDAIQSIAQESSLPKKIKEKKKAAVEKEDKPKEKKSLKKNKKAKEVSNEEKA